MSRAGSVFDEHERRLAEITAIGVEVKAFFFDGEADEVTLTGDQSADRRLYARAFQAWADGKIEGEAEDVFETVQEALGI